MASHKLEKELIKRGHPSRFLQTQNKTPARTPQSLLKSSKQNSSEDTPVASHKLQRQLKRGHPSRSVQTQNKIPARTP